MRPAKALSNCLAARNTSNNPRTYQKSFASRLRGPLLRPTLEPPPDFQMDESRKTLIQIIRFLMVSGISLSIDYSVYTLLSAFAEMDSSWAKRISFACIFVWGYFAHKYFTFRNRGFHPSEPFRFALLYLSGWVINSVVHDLSAADPKASNPAFLVATFVWACWNFLGQKFFVFRRREAEEG